MTPPTSVVEQFVQRARGLYSLPAVAMRVLELTNSPKVDVRALKECLENDPALTTRILRVVNSSLFGLTREVTDLNQALALLGIKPLKMLVLGFSLPKNLFAALEADVLSRYWRHTLTKAVVARELAQRCWHQPGEDAFIAGLLQEIGQLALIQDLGEPYVRFVDRVLASGGDLRALELETLGFDHALLSARLLDHWGLPESIVRAIGAPQVAARLLALPPQEQPLAQILHLAELIARLLTAERAHSLEDLLEACRQYQRVNLDELPLLLDDLDEKVQQLADVLKLQLADGSDYRTVLADAHTQLASVAGEAALELLQPVAAWNETAALTKSLVALSRLPRVPNVAPSPAAPPARASAPASMQPETRRSFGTEADWNEPGLLGKLQVTLQACRQQRLPLTLLLAEVDYFDQWILTCGKEATLALMRRLEELFAARLDPGSASLHVGDGRFALLLANCDRQDSIVTARELQRTARRASESLEALGPTLSISIGLASLDVPPKNFPAQELISAASRCLSGAHLAGGDTLKSIELV